MHTQVLAELMQDMQYSLIQEERDEGCVLGSKESDRSMTTVTEYNIFMRDAHQYKDQGIYRI